MKLKNVLRFLLMESYGQQFLFTYQHRKKSLEDLTIDFNYLEL